MINMPIEKLREALNYDPSTGVITWAKSRGTAKAGSIAGGKDGQGYWKIGFMGFDLMGHRVAFALHYGRWPEKHIDHIDHDKSDNRISNLREASASDNLRNLRPRENTVSGYKGVHKASDRSWQATLRVNGKPTHVGQFKTSIEAALAYDAAARTHYGEFACTNFPTGESA